MKTLQEDFKITEEEKEGIIQRLASQCRSKMDIGAESLVREALAPVWSSDTYQETCIVLRTVIWHADIWEALCHHRKMIES